VSGNITQRCYLFTGGSLIFDDLLIIKDFSKRREKENGYVKGYTGGAIHFKCLTIAESNTPGVLVSVFCGWFLVPSGDRPATANTFESRYLVVLPRDTG
jgi:hypothetical protein